MNVVFWIVYIGLCIKTGAMIISFGVSIFVSQQAASDLHLGLNLLTLYNFSKYHYFGTATMLIALSALKANIAYLVVKIFMKFDLSNPFNPEVTSLITRISHNALNAGILSFVASGYTKWLVNKQDVVVPIDWAGEEILFFAGILYIIAMVFKRGTELQTENDLTV
jgi:hypothetical protein